MRTLAVFTVLALAPLCFAQDKPEKTSGSDMQRAIAFQHAKDRADARQARREQSHPSVDNAKIGQREPLRKGAGDPGEKQWKKDKK